jgi:hypothetical protein
MVSKRKHPNQGRRQNGGINHICRAQNAFGVELQESPRPSKPGDSVSGFFLAVKWTLKMQASPCISEVLNCLLKYEIPHHLLPAKSCLSK